MAASMRNPVVVILGATGTGKTKLSLELARRFNGEIISADAMQVYKGLDIITNKATSEERHICPHHMIDYLSPMKDNSTVVDFRNSALPIIDGLLQKQKLPIVVGGTNYYIESLLWQHLISDEDVEKARIGGASAAKIPRLNETLLQSDDGGNSKTDDTNHNADVSVVTKDDVSEGPEQQTSDSTMELKSSGSPSDCHSHSDNNGEPNSDKMEMRGGREKYEGISNHDLHRRLMEVDSVTARKMHPNNRRKIIRALEVYDRTGVCLSDVYRAQHPQSALRGPLRYTDTCVFWLQCDRDVLDARLDGRVDKMVTEGLVDELTTFHDQYNQQRLQDGRKADYTTGIFQSIGFKEFHDYLVLSGQERGSERGKQLLEKGIEDLKTATRKYARYQMKWVQNRLLRRSEPADEIPPLYGLDCTDVSRWEDTVASPAVAILSATMEGETPPVPCLPLVEEPVVEYEYNECKICDMVLITKHEWKAHQGTRRHRNLKKRYKRELGNLTQTLDTHIHNKTREATSEETSPS